uniref:Putative secreted protein n=1 Tax=Anopheles triannulatus TaxID=58253 RepID=A0A2M4B1D2_9DIPT
MTLASLQFFLICLILSSTMRLRCRESLRQEEKLVLMRPTSRVPANRPRPRRLLHSAEGPLDKHTNTHTHTQTHLRVCKEQERYLNYL